MRDPGFQALPALAAEVFAARWGEPTPAQRLAWPAIAAGQNVLVAAPTGSGKTLAAFYAFLARAVETPMEEAGVEVVYVSPLKALASDVERNLRVPLQCLREAMLAAGRAPAPVPVSVRSGDTPKAERAAALRRPPRILVTTPESLYLLLTSPRARATLTTVRAVIVDEAHALLDSKRGTHLLLSLERLERATGRSIQRIGLSATAPLETCAAWLAGFDGSGAPRPMAILDAGGREKKHLELSLGAPGGGAPLAPGRMWHDVAAEIIPLARKHRSTLVFCNSRRQAERISALINELAGETLAHAHHGAMARERRQELEERLKAGELRCLVATGSLELGIDVGAIELVVQLGSPKSVSRGLQRVGRAGHLVGATARGRIIGQSRADLLEAATVARGMQEGAIEPARPPEGCLDVLAQQIVAEVAGDRERVDQDELLACYRRAWPYRRLERADYSGVLEMLAGRFESPLLRDFRARLDWDRKNGWLGPLPGTRARAVARPGTIPDRGMFRVELDGERARLGELDEEFVFESRAGDVFLLGTSAWRIVRIERDRVRVRPAAPGEPARMPFWRGEGLGRGAALGERLGALTRELVAKLPDRAAAAEILRHQCAADGAAADGIVDLLARQLEATGAVPDDRTVIFERYEDEEGWSRVALLSPWGNRTHLAWATLLAAEASRRLQLELAFQAGDDGILFRTPEGDAAEALLEAHTWLRAEDVAGQLAELVDGTALYAAAFREAAQRSLILSAGRSGGRAPLWLARLRAADLEQLMRAHPDFPVAREARREALADVLDVPALTRVIARLNAGEARAVAARRSLPSPLASQLTYAFTAAFLYDGDAPRVERRARALSAGRDAAIELLSPDDLEDLLEPAAVEALEARRRHRAPGTRARTPEELVEILRRVGDLEPAELAAASDVDPAPLLHNGRVVRIGERLVPAEDESLWTDPDDAARREILRRFAAASGPFTAAAAAARYAWAIADVEAALAELVGSGVLARGRFVRAGGADTFADRRNLAELHRRTLSILRDRGAPAGSATYAAFLLARHRAASVTGAVHLLAGVRAPGDVLERDLLWRRLEGYQPPLLDAACGAGDVAWLVDGPRVALVPRGELAAWLPEPDERGLDAGEAAVLEALSARGASFSLDLLTATKLRTAELFTALWSLARRGLVGNDAFEAYRRAAAMDFAPASTDLELSFAPDALRRMKRARPSPWVGRWVRLPAPLPLEQRAAVQASGLLRRYGIVGKAVVDAESGTCGWPAIEAALTALELRGEVVRGYFVDGLGPYQVALSSAVDELRAPRDPERLELVAAVDPANPWGVVAPLPETRTARVPSTHLVLRGGAPLLLVEQHGKKIRPLAEAPKEVVIAALRLMARFVTVPAHLRAVRSVTVLEYAGKDAGEAAELFIPAGFSKDGERMLLGVTELARMKLSSDK